MLARAALEAKAIQKMRARPWASLAACDITTTTTPQRAKLSASETQVSQYVGRTVNANMAVVASTTSMAQRQNLGICIMLCGPRLGEAARQRIRDANLAVTGHERPRTSAAPREIRWARELRKLLHRQVDCGK